MDSVYTLETFLKVLYPDTNIPSYLCDTQKKKILSARPDQDVFTFPPVGYVEKLTEKAGHVACLSTEYGAYFGRVSLASAPDLCLIFGPVSLVPYSAGELHRLILDYVVPQEKRGAFQEFLQRIPQLPVTSFCRKLIFINYCINGEVAGLSHILPASPSRSDSSVHEVYEKKTYAVHNKSWEIEAIVRDIIRSGKPEEIERLEFNESAFNAGITGPTALRQMKNNIIISTTLATRAAIDGGLDPDIAYQLSDNFIQTAERISAPDALTELMGKIAYTFAERVRDAQIPVSSDGIIQNAIRYIQQNTCEHITAEDVAAHAGFSRSYFSTYFKKELGFSVNAFIRRCKMEEAKQLLKYTDKPVSVISSYLCFSCQSHFQTAFKKEFGVTPLEYRKNPSSIES